MLTATVLGATDPYGMAVMDTSKSSPPTTRLVPSTYPAAALKLSNDGDYVAAKAPDLVRSATTGTTTQPSSATGEGGATPWYKNTKVVVPVAIGGVAALGILVWLLK